jgi:hypothetical protein
MRQGIGGTILNIRAIYENNVESRKTFGVMDLMGTE